MTTRRDKLYKKRQRRHEDIAMRGNIDPQQIIELLTKQQ
jgi:hypothetical protein